MKVTIEINGDNAAFFDDDGSVKFGEFSRILHNVADRYWYSVKGKPIHLRDINGNVCGFIEITEG